MLIKKGLAIVAGFVFFLLIYQISDANYTFARIIALLCLVYVSVIIASSFRPERRSVILLFFLIASLLCLLPERLSHDSTFHTFRVTEAASAIREFHWNLSMAWPMADGYGLPLFIYYPAWIYFLPGILHAAGLPAFVALKVCASLLFCILAIGTYLVLSQFVRNQLAFIGTLLFCASNFVITVIFVRFSYGEYFAACLFPFSYYFFYRWLTSLSTRDAILFILIYVLVFLAYPASAVITIAALAITGIGLLFEHKPVNVALGKLVFQTIVIVLLFLLLTCFYWMPYIAESPYVLMEKGLPENYASTLLTIKDYLKPFDFYHPGAIILMAFVFSLVSFIFSFKYISSRRRFKVTLIITVVFYLFLTLKISSFVWESCSVLRTIVFAFRLYMPLGFFISLFFVLSFDEQPSLLFQSPQAINLFSMIIILHAMVVLLILLNFGLFVAPQGDPKKALESYLAERRGWAVSEYLPNTANIPVIRGKIAGNLKARRIKTTGEDVVFEIPVPASDGYYKIDKYWNVRYSAASNKGRSRVLSDDDGQIVLKLSTEMKNIRLLYKIPGYVVVTKQISAGTLLIVLLWLINHCRRMSQRQASILPTIPSP